MCGQVPHVPGPIDRKNIQVAEQSVAARLRLSASHVCTWALLMQEDCLAMWTLQPGTTHASPLRPRMASGRVELRKHGCYRVQLLILRTDARRQGGIMLLHVSAEYISSDQCFARDM